MLGCKEPAVSLLLNGKRSWTDDKIEKMCDYFGITLCDLDKWADDPSTQTRLPACPDMNPVHLSFHSFVEAVLHKGPTSQQARFNRIVLATLDAMVAASAEPPSENEHGTGYRGGSRLPAPRRKRTSD